MSLPQDDPAFIAAYDHWRNLAFPEGSPVDSIDELKADLALVDVYVADTVIPFRDGRGWMAPVVDVPRAIANLEQRIDASLAAAQPVDRDLLIRYHDYCAALRQVWVYGNGASSPASG